MRTRQFRAGTSLQYTADKACLCHTRVMSTEPRTKDDGGGLPRLLCTATPDRTMKPASGTVTSEGYLFEGEEGAGARLGQGSGDRQDSARAAGDDCD